MEVPLYFKGALRLNNNNDTAKLTNISKDVNSYRISRQDIF